MPTDLRIVYDGPALAGRTSSMLRLHAWLNGSTVERRGAALELVASTDAIMLHVAAVVGAACNADLQAELRANADAFVFVADSQRERWEANEDHARVLERVVRENAPRPVVLQLNKRDLPNALPVQELLRLTRWNTVVFETTATKGNGVWEPFETAVLMAARWRGVEEAARQLLARSRVR